MATDLIKPGKKWARNAQLARHFDVSAMCIWRWKRDPELGCPSSYVINDIEYNDLDAWDAWIKSRIVNRIDKDSKKSRADRFKGRASQTQEVA